jgi:Uncharacterised protein family (UPF0236)
MSNTESKQGLGEFTDGELSEELARRRAASIPGGMWEFEEMLEKSQHNEGLSAYQAYVDRRYQEYGDRPRACPKCGKSVGVRAKDRERDLRTMSGEVKLHRHYHYCDDCKAGFYPLDTELGLDPEGELSPKLSSRILDFALHSPFEEAAERWRIHHQTEASENLFRRVTDRAGRRIEEMEIDELQCQLRPEAKSPAEVLVVEMDGSHLPMRGKEVWKEAKLCVVYRDEHHLPKSDEKRGAITKARYSATLQPADEFRLHVDKLLKVERAEEAKTVVWLGDGAPMNWNIADELCPKAVQVLDWAHAIEHAANCAKKLFGETSPWIKTWTDTVAQRLKTGHIDDIIIEIDQCRRASRGEAKKALDDLHRYYTNHRERMRYDRFRSQNLPIGSGVVESAHRHVLQKRMKLAGQHWEPKRAERMARLRAASKTAGLETFYEVIRAAA